MKNGDISNEMPRRLLVNADIFVTSEVEYTRKFLVLVKINKHLSYDKIVLNQLYRLTVTTGITIELFSYQLDQDEIELLHAELDRMGTNPFRYATAYKSHKDLVKELPYRPEVIGVVDIESRKLYYGHWSLDLK